MSILIETTKSIANYITQLVGDSAQVQRNYLPIVDSEQLQALAKPLIFVVPYSCNITNLSRAIDTFKFEVDITISAKLNHRNDTIDEQVEEIDNLIKLNEKIFTHFILSVTIAGKKSKIVCKEPKQEILIDYDIIEEMNCFFSVIRLFVETNIAKE
jgi:hypothetical protein